MNKKIIIKVDIDDNDNINWALKKFKRKCESFGIIKEYRKRKAFKKPSVRKKEKREAARKRNQKENRRRRSYSKI